MADRKIDVKIGTAALVHGTNGALIIRVDEECAIVEAKGDNDT